MRTSGSPRGARTRLRLLEDCSKRVELSRVGLVHAHRRNGHESVFHRPEISPLRLRGALSLVVHVPVDRPPRRVLHLHEAFRAGPHRALPGDRVPLVAAGRYRGDVHVEERVRR